MSEVQMMVRGYLAQDPRVSQTNSGRAVGNVLVPHTPRRFNRESSAWEDSGATLWVEATVWGDGVDILSGLVKGDEVVVNGTPALEEFKRRDGSPGTKLTLRSASVALVQRKSTRQARQESRGASNAASVDPWGTPAANGPQTGAQQPWGDESEIPF